MFKEIEAMMGEETQSVSLIVTKNKDGLTVTVLPKTKDGADPAMSAPMVLNGTAEEMDAEFVTLLSKFSGERKSLAEQLADTEAILKAAKDASQNKAKTALKKGAKESPAPAKAPGSACSAGACDSDDEGDQTVPAAPAAGEAQTPAPAAVPNLFD